MFHKSFKCVSLKFDKYFISKKFFVHNCFQHGSTNVGQMFDLCSIKIHNSSSKGQLVFKRLCSTIVLQVFPQVINKFVDVFQQMLARVNKRSTSFPHMLTQYSAGAQQVYSKRFPKVLIECYDDQQKVQKGVFFYCSKSSQRVFHFCSTEKVCHLCTKSCARVPKVFRGVPLMLQI